MIRCALSSVTPKRPSGRISSIRPSRVINSSFMRGPLRLGGIRAPVAARGRAAWKGKERPERPFGSVVGDVSPLHMGVLAFIYNRRKLNMGADLHRHDVGNLLGSTHHPVRFRKRPVTERRSVLPLAVPRDDHGTEI